MLEPLLWPFEDRANWNLAQLEPHLLLRSFEARAEVSSAQASFIFYECLRLELKLAQLEPHFFLWTFEARAEVSSAQASFIFYERLRLELKLAQLKPHLLLWTFEARAEVSSARASLLFWTLLLGVQGSTKDFMSSLAWLIISWFPYYYFLRG